MKTYFCLAVLFIDLLFLALPQTSAASNQQRLGVSFAASNTIAPYFYQDQSGGIQYDLLKQALASQQMFISRISLAPNRRALRLALSQQEDCLVNAPENIPGLHYTRSLNEYQNRVFTLKSSHLNFEHLKDLEVVSLLGFQNAAKFLGSDFKSMSTNNPQYSEIANQQSQISMLFLGRVQAIVLEKKIFDYYRKLLSNRVNTNLETDEFKLFADAPRRIACRNRDIAEKIDAGIQYLRSTSQYHKILNTPLH